MTVLVRLPNHVGDACMALPALHLLRDAGLRCALVGRGWGDSLLEGMHLHYVTIQGRLLHDVARIKAAPKPIEDVMRGLGTPELVRIGAAVCARRRAQRGAGDSSSQLAAALAQPGAG